MHRPMISRFLAVLAVVFGCASAQAATPFSDEQKADLKRASDYLNGMKTMKSNFIQMSPDGSSGEGIFYLMRPGRMRFEYAPPNPNLIVSDGRTIAVENSQLNTIDRYPLIDSPLKLFLSDNIDLNNDSHVAAVEHQPGILVVTARQTSGPAQGEITLIFAEPSLELRQWDVIDSQGLKTTIVLNDVQSGIDIPPNLFVIRDRNPFKKSGD